MYRRRTKQARVRMVVRDISKWSKKDRKMIVKWLRGTARLIDEEHKFISDRFTATHH